MLVHTPNDVDFINRKQLYSSCGLYNVKQNKAEHIFEYLSFANYVQKILTWHDPAVRQYLLGTKQRGSQY